MSEVTLATTQATGSVLSPLSQLLKNEYFQEFTAGTTAAVAVAAPMTIIDKAIIRAQFRKTSLTHATTSLTKELFTGVTPWNPALNIMFKVYGGTYLTANLTEAVCHDIGVNPSTPTAVLTSLVNCALIAWKDKEYSKFYNTKNMDNFPKISYRLFALRDGLTIVSSFNLKHKARHVLQDEYGYTHTQAELISSFLVPMSAQLISTPLHIIALDIFDNPNATISQRLSG